MSLKQTPHSIRTLPYSPVLETLESHPCAYASERAVRRLPPYGAPTGTANRLLSSSCPPISSQHLCKSRLMSASLLRKSPICGVFPIIEITKKSSYFINLH